MATHIITTNDDQDAALAEDLRGSKMTPTEQLQEWIDHRLNGRVDAIRRATVFDSADVREVAEKFAAASPEEQERAKAALGLDAKAETVGAEAEQLEPSVR